MTVRPDPILLDPTPVSFNESLAMARALDAKTRECYLNSIIGASTLLDDTPPDQIYYVEGIAIDYMGIPFEHGWIRAGDKLLDPTWVLIKSPHKMTEVKYFPAILYTLDDIKEALRSSTSSRVALRLPLFMYEPGKRSGFRFSAEIAKAMDAANRFLYGDDFMNKLVSLNIKERP